MTERAVLAGGCFWGMQDLIRKLPGVIETRVGYTGGDVPNATYRNHGTHAEAIEIVFDPKTISYRRILEYFFQIHDPTTRNRQGNDVGSSYRSAIYYVDEEQKRVAEDTIADVDASGLWPGKAVTEVVPVGDFWQAEPEHQDYLERYPNGYTCHFPRPNWVLPPATGGRIDRPGLFPTRRLLHSAETLWFTLIDPTGQAMGASTQQACGRCDMGHRHDQDRAIEPNLAMSTASVATNST